MPICHLSSVGLSDPSRVSHRVGIRQPPSRVRSLALGLPLELFITIVVCVSHSPVYNSQQYLSHLDYFPLAWHQNVLGFVSAFS